MTSSIDAYVREMDGYTWPTVFLNRGAGGYPVNITVSFSDLGLPVHNVSGFDVLDLFTGAYSGYLPPGASYSYRVPPSGVTFVKIGIAE